MIVSWSMTFNDPVIIKISNIYLDHEISMAFGSYVIGVTWQQH